MTAQRISYRTETMIRSGSTIATLAVVISAGTLSWAGLSHLAVESGINPTLAVAFPVVVDGLAVSASLVLLRNTLAGVRHVRYAWTMLVLAAVLSVLGNIASSTEQGWIALLVHGAAPLIMVLSLELLMGLLRSRIASQVEKDTEAEAEARRIEQQRAEAEERQRAAEEKRAQAAERARLRAEQAQVQPQPRLVSAPAPDTFIDNLRATASNWEHGNTALVRKFVQEHGEAVTIDVVDALGLTKSDGSPASRSYLSNLLYKIRQEAQEAA